MRLPSACANPVEELSCFNPNPCEGRCGEDGDCQDDEYCDEAGFCSGGCREDGCPAGGSCDPDSRECVAETCGQDADCDDAFFCSINAGECVRGCRLQPDNCPDGSYCTANRQCGEGCLDDVQCEARNGDGWYCVLGECQAPCAMDSECVGDRICNGGRCVPGCREDQQNNRARDRAVALALDEDGVYESGELVLAACPGTSDWFRFDVPQAGWRIDVQVEFDPEIADLDARLHPPEGAPIVGDNIDEPESFELSGVEAGRWHLEVFPRGDSRSRYQLRVELLPPVACVPDQAEAGAGDDARDQATRVDDAGAVVNHRERNRTVCEGDEDWYAVPLGAGDGLAVKLVMMGNGLDANNELDFAIYAPDAEEPTFVPDQAGMEGEAPFVQFEIARGNPQIQAGDHHIVVRGIDALQWGRYELRIDVERGQQLCAEDEAEPNADLDSAYDLMALEGFTRERLAGGIELIPGRGLDLEALSLCGDEDHYRVELGAGDELEVTVERQEADPVGDTIVEILDADGQLVGVPGRNSAVRNVARVEDAVAGEHYVRVSAVVPQTETFYTLTLLRQAGMQEECPDDRFDEGGGNDARGAATVVVAGDVGGLVLCGQDDDEDWYRLDVDGVADITVEICFDNDQANLQLDLFAGDAGAAENAEAAAGHGNGDCERVLLDNYLPGIYYARVSTLAGGNARYEMTITIDERVFVCEDDPDEPNGAFADATELGADDVDGRDTQWICDRVPSEADIFAIEVPGNTARTIVAEFVYQDDGDLVIEMFDHQEMLVGTTSEIPRANSKQCIVVEPFGADRLLYVRLTPLAINRVGQDDERLDYSLTIRDGDLCDELAPAPGVVWPRVPPPF